MTPAEPLSFPTNLEQALSLGWPPECGDQSGLLTWRWTDSAKRQDLIATVMRGSDLIEFGVKYVSPDGDDLESLLDATIESAPDGWRCTAAKAGNPPEAIPTDEASDLFRFMTGSMGAPRFRSFGPLVVPRSGVHP